MFDLPGMSGMSQTFEAMKVLDVNIKTSMNPLQMRKAGAIIQNMQVCLWRVNILFGLRDDLIVTVPVAG